MNAIQVLRANLELAQRVALGYLDGFSDSSLLQRPHPQSNTVNWQVGHLILSEHHQVGLIPEANMPSLPPGFGEIYAKPVHSPGQVICVPADTSIGEMASKTTLMHHYHQQRTETLRVLASMTPPQLKRASGIDYAPTHAEIFNMQAAHWLMHCGQWAVVRRQLGLPIVI